MKVANGHNVQVHYKGTFPDGTEFDNSYTRGKTLDFQVGSGMIIKGFDEAVLGMAIGESKTVSLGPELAYGPVNPNAVSEVSKDKFPANFEFEEGARVRATAPTGQPFFGVLTEINDKTVVVDMNHPLAGKELNFEIELVSVAQPRPAPSPSNKVGPPNEATPPVYEDPTTPLPSEPTSE